MANNVYVSSRREFECTYLGTVDPKTGKLPLESHRYTVEVTVVSDPNYPLYSDGQIISFERLNKLLEVVVLDHAWVVADNSQVRKSESRIVEELQSLGVTVERIPVSVVCAETIAEYIGSTVQTLLNRNHPDIHVLVDEVKLRENSRNYVVWKPQVR